VSRGQGSLVEPEGESISGSTGGGESESVEDGDMDALSVDSSGSCGSKEGAAAFAGRRSERKRQARDLAAESAAAAAAAANEWRASILGALTAAGGELSQLLNLIELTRGQQFIQVCSRCSPTYRRPYWI
jgi:hypothetical protein